MTASLIGTRMSREKQPDAAVVGFTDEAEHRQEEFLRAIELQPELLEVFRLDQLVDGYAALDPSSTVVPELAIVGVVAPVPCRRPGAISARPR